MIPFRNISSKKKNRVRTTSSTRRSTRIVLVYSIVLMISLRQSAAGFVAVRRRTIEASSSSSSGTLRNPRNFVSRKTTMTTTVTKVIRRGGGATVAAAVVGASSLFNGTPFWLSQKIFLGANSLGFLLSLVTRKQFHVDLLGTGAFAAAVLPSLLSSLNRTGLGGGTAAAAYTRILLSASAITMWSTKLALFLLYRCVKKGGIDKRLLETLTVPKYSAGFWSISLFWGVICSLPHTLGTTSSLPVHPVVLIVGTVTAALGLCTESLADYQKWAFKQQLPSIMDGNTIPKFCNTGLWSFLQHPNYFGNLLFWVGILILNAPALIEPPLPTTVATATATAAATTVKGKLTLALHHVFRYRRLALSLLSPIFMYYLFNGQATGTILGDQLEKRHKKYGYFIDPIYTEYVDTTPLIIPFTK